ncbi:MAG: phosphate acyltransferase PlsX [Deltaproteobacteria bacterium]|nr:phosphate acyltransferase PlsX [Deltaproteobacteria bacterium]MBZ0219883.1 phosphate acyltransferase PlsX [Deltaproteobacteria bacterium]
MKIAVDAMGGDFAPAMVVEGAVRAASELNIPIVLVGDKSRVEDELAKQQGVPSNVSIVHASEVVGMDESPTQAVRKKKDSSLRVCFELVRSGEAGAVVSAGNSGAAMAAGILILKKVKGIDRPAIAVSVPTIKDPAIVLDVGGNVDCKPVHLFQFALMGEVYARYVLKEKRPRVGLLSNGEEDGKGNELTRETHALLKKASINYIGYVEGRDIYQGGVDVVVTDGFVGNVVLKLSEGLVEAVTTMLKNEIMSSLPSRLGYLLSKGAFKRLKKKIDYSEYGGAPLLGIEGVCIISHGRSNAKAMRNAVLRAHEYAQGNVNSHLMEEMEKNHDLMKNGRNEAVSGS